MQRCKDKVNHVFLGVPPGGGGGGGVVDFVRLVKRTNCLSLSALFSLPVLRILRVVEPF